MSSSGLHSTLLRCALFSLIAASGGFPWGCSGGDDNPPPASSSNSPTTPGTSPGTNPGTGPGTSPGTSPGTGPGTGPGGGGAVGPTAQPGRFNDRVTAIIAAPDASGDVYVAGTFTTYNDRPVPPVVRIRPNGALNETFKLAGSLNAVVSIAAVDDGSGDIYVGQLISPSINLQENVGRIWKVNADGTIDDSFMRGEVVDTTPECCGFLASRIHTIVPAGDGSGRAYVCGVFDRYNGTPVQGIVRVTPAGTLDTSFQSAAVNQSQTFTVIQADDGTGDLYVMNWRIIDITSPTTASTDVYRLNADGSFDPAFQRFTSLPFGTVMAVLPVGDGSGDIFVGGTSMANGTGPATSPLNNPSAFSTLLRVHPDGTLDQTSPRPAVKDFVSLMLRAVDGTRDLFIVARQFMRFKPDSSIDPAFTIGTASFITTLLLVSDGTGDIYVGGEFTTHNGVPVGNIVRLNANGTLDGS